MLLFNIAIEIIHFIKVMFLFFFPVEVRACSSVWKVRFLLFHWVPVAAKFVSVWVGIANDLVLSYNLFSSFVQQSPLLTSDG